MLKYLIVIVALFCSCQNFKKETTNNTVFFSKFPSQENLTFHNFIKYDNGIISRLYFNDTSLIAYDWRGAGGYYFYEYDLRSKQNIRKYIPNGSSKGKSLGSLSSGIYKNYLWMYDINLSKIISANLDNVTSSSDSYAYKEYPFSGKYYNIQFLNDDKVIANGNYETPNKIQEVDLISGKIIADYGVIDSVPKDIPLYAWKRANESLMALKPSGNKVVLAHLSNDNIEIFDLNSHSSITVKGPENYKIEFTPFKSDTNQDLIQRNEESRVGFTNVVVTDKYIYVLYSGDNVTNPNSIYANTLYLYNWEGQPIKMINLDRYVSGFTVSNDDKTLYAFDVVSNYIVTTKI